MEKKTGYNVHDRLFKELIQNFFQEFMEGFSRMCQRISTTAG